MKTSLPPTLFLLLSSHQRRSDPSSRSSTTDLPSDCALSSCDRSLTRLINNPSHPDHDSHTTTTTSKQASHHSVQSLDHLKITISITETSSKNTPPNVALSTDEPLSSDYLQSIKPSNSHKQKSPEVVDLEQKVSHYLSTHPASASKLPSASLSSVKKTKPCKAQTVYLPGNTYITTHHYVSRNPDIAVIGVVLLFLVAILAIECAERVAQFTTKRNSKSKQKDRKGEIYLSDEKPAVMFLDVERAISVREESESEWEVVSNDEKDAVEFKDFMKA